MVVGLAIGGLWSGGMDGWRGGAGGPGHLEGVDQERIVSQARIPLTALGVEDPERRPTPRRPVAVVGDERLGALADDVATQADPRPTSQLEPDAGRLVDRGREAASKPGRIEDQQQRLRAPGERGESMESIGDLRWRVGPGQATTGQVEDEQVDRAAGEERARDAQALVEAGRGDDDEPLEADAAGDGLDRVEAARQIEPGDDGAPCLGLGGRPEGEGRAAAGAVATDGNAGRGRQAARAQDRIERGKAGVDDPLAWEWRDRRLDIDRLGGVGHLRLGGEGQGPDDPRSCGTPAGLEARDCGVHVTTRGRHRTPRLEHLF
jgi:hypothetical protein